MYQRLKIQLLLSASLLCLFTPVFTQSTELRKEINKLISYDTDIDLKSNPGFMIGVIDNDSTFFFRYGATVDNEGETYDEQSVFEIGGLTKVFTAGLLEVLAKEGHIKYTDRVNSYLPEDQRNPRMKDLTIYHLAMHLSGFPKRPTLFGKKEKERNNPYKYYTKADLIKFYTQYVPNKDEYEKFKFAHTNYALIEYVLEQKMQSSFEVILKEHLLSKLDLSKTYLDPTELRATELSTGYNRAGIDASPWVFQSFGGSEGLKSNVKELSEYVRANMGISHTELDKTLPATHEIQLSSTYDKNIHLGKAWHIIDTKSDYDIRMHTGTTGGHKAFVAFVDETKTGVVLLSNSSLGTEDLGMLILRMINHNWKRKA
jgi:CubicO group peptidase (beta-lactamase class C family)